MAVISAGNIQQITTEIFNKEAACVPSLEDVIESIKPKHRKKLQAAIDILPEGMKLIPVYYTRISKEQNQATMKEFLQKVAPAFYKKLANENEKELLEAGFCQYSIDEMKKGHIPADKEGRYYPYDLDHIIERSGSGPMAFTQEEDLDWPNSDPEKSTNTFQVNHLGNLYLIPMSIHDIKNTINKYQLINIEEGETRLIYMAVPEKEEGSPSFYRHAKATVEKEADPIYSSHAALAASEKCVRLSEKLIKFGYVEDINTMNEICDLDEATFDYLSKWYEITQDIIKQMEESGNKINGSHRKIISKNQEDMAENLKIILRVLPYLAEIENQLNTDFSSILLGNMSIQASVEETEKKFEESILS